MDYTGTTKTTATRLSPLVLQLEHWLSKGTTQRFIIPIEVLQDNVTVNEHLLRQTLHRWPVTIEWGDNSEPVQVAFHVDRKADTETIMTPDPADARRFSHARYHELVEETVLKLKELGQKKGGEYAGDDDRLANFRRNAERMGLNMETIWGVYAAKHWDAIMQFIQDLNTGKTRPRMESLAGRADDIIVYMILFKAMLEEREAGTSDD